MFCKVVLFIYGNHYQFHQVTFSFVCILKFTYLQAEIILRQLYYGMELFPYIQYIVIIVFFSSQIISHLILYLKFNFIFLFILIKSAKNCFFFTVFVSSLTNKFKHSSIYAINVLRRMCK